MTMMTRAAATAAAAAAASITPHTRFNLRTTLLDRKSGKRSPYSITERRVPELIPAGESTESVLKKKKATVGRVCGKGRF